MIRNKCGLDGFCPLCYAGAKGRSSHRGHAGVHPAPSSSGRTWRHHVRRPVPNDQSPGAGDALPGGQLASRHPELAEHLCRGTYDDGTARELSTLSLFWEGQPKAALNDRECKRSLYVAGDSWEDCLDALESMLADETGQWRPWKGGSRKK